MMPGVKVTSHEFGEHIHADVQAIIMAEYPAGLYWPGTQSYIRDNCLYFGHPGFDGIMRWVSEGKPTMTQTKIDQAEADSLINMVEQYLESNENGELRALLELAQDEETPALMRQTAHRAYNMMMELLNSTSGDEPPPSGGAPKSVAEFVIAEAAAQDASPERQAYLDDAVEALDAEREAYLDGFLVDELAGYRKQSLTFDVSQEVADKVARALYASGKWDGLEPLHVNADPRDVSPQEGTDYDFPQRQSRFTLRYKQGCKWLVVSYAWSDDEAVLFGTVDEARMFAQSYVYDNDLEGDVEFECRRYDGTDSTRFTILSGDVLMPADEDDDDNETLGKGKLTLGALNRQTVELKQRVAQLTAERDELLAVLTEMEAEVNALLARKGRAYKADPLLADASIVQQLEAELDFAQTAPPVEFRTLVQLMSWDPRQSVTYQTGKADADLSAHLNDGWTIINLTINTVVGNDGTRHYRYVTLQRAVQPVPAPVPPAPDGGEGKEAVSPEGENAALANAQGEKSPSPDLLANKPIGRAIREHGLSAVTDAMNAQVVQAARNAYEAADDDHMPALALAEVV